MLAPLLIRSASSFHGFLRRLLDSLGVDLTPEQGMTLSILRQVGAQSVSSLAAIMNKDRTTVSRFVDQLANAGWVLRSPSTEDRRNVVVTLSDAGLELISRIDPQVMGAVMKLLAGIPAEDLAVTEHVLQQVLERSATAEV